MKPTLLLTSAIACGAVFSSSLCARAVTFVPPDNEAPQQTQGGASRGQVTFMPPSGEVPQQTQGGASRDGVTFEPPSDRPPVVTSGAGSRSTELSLTALLPGNHYGQTRQGRPTILVYRPETPHKQGFFSILDEAGNLHYQTHLPLHKAGLVRLELPPSVAELEIGPYYQWHFALVDEAGLRPDSPRVSGWIERVEGREQPTPELSLKLAERYGREGLWYDTLSTLYDLRERQPEALQLHQSWRDLLNQVGLNAVADRTTVE